MKNARYWKPSSKSTNVRHRYRCLRGATVRPHAFSTSADTSHQRTVEELPPGPSSPGLDGCSSSGNDSRPCRSVVQGRDSPHTQLRNMSDIITLRISYYLTIFERGVAVTAVQRLTHGRDLWHPSFRSVYYIHASDKSHSSSSKPLTTSFFVFSMFPADSGSDKQKNLHKTYSKFFDNRS